MRLKTSRRTIIDAPESQSTCAAVAPMFIGTHHR